MMSPCQNQFWSHELRALRAYDFRMLPPAAPLPHAAPPGASELPPQYTRNFVRSYKDVGVAADAAPEIPSGVTSVVRLPFHPPLNGQVLLDFFGVQQVRGVETMQGSGALREYRRTVRLGASSASQSAPHTTGWIALRMDPARSEVLLHTSASLALQLEHVVQRVRCMWDLDTDTGPIDALMAVDFPAGAGIRVPGCWDGFEVAVRTVLGQQITLAAARTITGRLVERFGETVQTPWAELNRLFPTAEALAHAPSDVLGSFGIVRQRQAAIGALAQAVLSGALQLRPGGDVPRAIAQLRAVPGIGDWTAQTIAMRALRWRDAFPSGDVALQKALGVREHPQPARAALEAAAAWRPWRSDAVMRAWACAGMLNRPLPPDCAID